MIPKLLKKKLIINNGLDLSKFIDHCLYDKNEGYYQKISSIGKDFLTSPEVSQLFGECIAIFYSYINRLKIFDNFNNIVELGPGNGTLMWDITRSLNKIKNLKKTNIILIEKSDNLVSVQKKKLRKIISKNFNIKWLKKPRLSKKESYFFVSNEFFDAFPVDQFVFKKNRLFKKKVILNKETLMLIDVPSKQRDQYFNFSNGDIIEYSNEIEIYIRQIFNYLKNNGGVFLLFDYGPYTKGRVDTIQSLHKKKKCDLLTFPTESDITHHIDFQELKKISKEYNLFCSGPSPQSKFLNMFGINERLDVLLKKVKCKKKIEKLENGFNKLTNPNEMGELFKFMIFSKKKIIF